MNIIFVIDSPYPNYAGGIENWLFNVSSRLCKNHNITIISEHPTFYENPFYLVDKRIKNIRYRTLRNIPLLRYFFRRSLICLTWLGRSRSIRKTIERAIDKDEKTIIVALTTLFAATSAKDIRNKYQNVKYICSCRGKHAEAVASKVSLLSKYVYSLENSNLKSADKILANGLDTIEYYSKRGVKLSLQKNGVDYKKFQIKYPAPVEYIFGNFKLVSTATLLDIKGINEMIKALSLIKDKDKEIDLYLVGKGDSSKYENLAKDCKVYDRVHFLGHKSNVIPYLQYADIVLCLSGGAGLSMAAIEALSCGKIVIAWDSPVYKQFNVEYQTMILIEENNFVDLANTIIDVKSNSFKYKQLRINAKTYSKSFDWENVVSDFVANIL